MSRDAATVSRIAAEAVAACPAPEQVADLDPVTRRAVARAADAAGISQADMWTKVRASSAARAGADEDARRIAAAARRR